MLYLFMSQNFKSISGVDPFFSEEIQGFGVAFDLENPEIAEVSFKNCIRMAWTYQNSLARMGSMAREGML